MGEKEGGRNSLGYGAGGRCAASCQGCGGKVGLKNEDVCGQPSVMGTAGTGTPPTLPPVRPELELGSEHENRTPLKFPEILGTASGLSHKMGNKKQPILFKSSKTE